MFIIEITKKSGKTCINISLQLVTAMPLSVGHQCTTGWNGGECRVPCYPGNVTVYSEHCTMYSVPLLYCDLCCASVAPFLIR